MRISIFLLLILPLVSGAQNVFFNEIMSSNDTIRDEFDETDDYIELYNSSDQPVDINGWYISDKADNPTKFTFAGTAGETVIPAKGFLILWADEDQEQGPLHVNFKISKDGESLYLYKPTSAAPELIDQVDVPALEPNATYSRTTDGGDTWAIRKRTFNESNFYIVLGSEYFDNEVKIFPTLVTENFTISNAKGQVYTIFDLNGKVLKSGSVSTNHEFVQSHTLTAGLNVIKVGSQSFKVFRK